MIAQEGEFSVLYECDPAKNEKCKKTDCHLTGGLCSKTRNVLYAKDATKAIMVIPMSQEEFNELKNEEGEVAVSFEKTAAPAKLQNRKESRHG